MKILILGIGNVMFGDEGLGVHFINLISQNFNFKSSLHELSFIDGGTMANALTPLIANSDYLIVCDCIEADDSKAGDVYFFDYNAMPKSIKWSGSAHEVEMLQTLQMCELSGVLPKSVKVLGVVPKRIEPMSFSLSPQAKNALKTMQKVLLDELNKLGFSCEQKANFNIDEILSKWLKALY